MISASSDVPLCGGLHLLSSADELIDPELGEAILLGDEETRRLGKPGAGGLKLRSDDRSEGAADIGPPAGDPISGAGRGIVLRGGIGGGGGFAMLAAKEMHASNSFRSLSLVLRESVRMVNVSFFMIVTASAESARKDTISIICLHPYDNEPHT
jgi:hypothetical protein